MPVKRLLLWYKWSPRHLSIVLFGVLAVSVIYYFSLPERLFTTPYSSILESKDGRLLGAHIAADGQWRFPEQGELSDKFVNCLITFEDRNYHRHFGVDPLAFLRASWQNLKSGRIVSGGSTLSMQVIRLSRKGRPRSLWEKVVEVVLATRLEWRYSKAEILKLYAGHAPFGGNVVGTEAAIWRYFGRQGNDLSWAEAALLAVLPNSPSLMHPGKNRLLLEKKRNRLLHRLLKSGKIDSLTCRLSKSEPLPGHPYPLPQYAPHLLERGRKSGWAQQRIRSSLDFDLQKKASEILNHYQSHFQNNEINNAALIIAEVSSGKTLAYIGNTHWADPKKHGAQVDIINAPRSTGSILKPFLYAAMLSEGKIMPGSLVEDIPLYIRGFAPKNFSRTYDGAVPADKAIARSLNIPAVNLLRSYRYEKFHQLLQKIGMRGLNDSPHHYGLSLILGGAEGSLWDITGMYASLGRVLHRFNRSAGSKRYSPDNFRPLQLKAAINDSSDTPVSTGTISAGAIWKTFEALQEVYRPEGENAWRMFETSRRIAWKTGTSFGYRDAWAIGLDATYVVGVWVGNADGEGRPGLTGIKAAAPILFDVFDVLPRSHWFKKPLADLKSTSVCRLSGYKNGPWCDMVDTLHTTVSSLRTRTCPYHRRIHLDASEKYQVHAGCEPLTRTHHENRFVLPPAIAHYYRSKNADYRPLPPFRKDCVHEAAANASVMEAIYPKKNARIYIPLELNGQQGKAIFEIAHRNPKSQVFWHIDHQFLGSTRRNHRFGIQVDKGKHTLTVMDQNGEILSQKFEVITK